VAGTIQASKLAGPRWAVAGASNQRTLAACENRRFSGGQKTSLLAN
jgi:hypothetical protein